MSKSKPPFKFKPLTISLAAICLVLGACTSTDAHEHGANSTTAIKAVGAPVLPISDPANAGGWVLNTDVSDEFNGNKIDESKWLVQGKNNDYYIWKGRAPSQFAAHNVLVEDGMLKIRSRWEPDFQFVDEEYAGNKYGEHDGKPMPVTTGGIISHKRFLNGYMEVRSKAGDAAMTSSFWSLGYESELDIYEQMGRPKLAEDIKEDTFKSSVHDWRPPAKRPTRKFGHKQKLPYRVADDFHTYAAEWGEDYLKFYIDGKLVNHVTQLEVGDHWVLTNPIELWFDSEIFTWLGLPHKEELPVDYEVDYVRVWQKPSNNLLHKDRAFFGFEGPILSQDISRPLTLLPENSENNEYQRFWQIDDASAQHLTISKERRSKGRASLRFLAETGLAENVAVVSPEGSINLPTGDYVLKMKIWLEPRSASSDIDVAITGTEGLSPIDAGKLSRGQWSWVEKKFTKTMASAGKDQLRLEFNKQGLRADKKALYFIDTISIEASNKN